MIIASEKRYINRINTRLQIMESSALPREICRMNRRTRNPPGIATSSNPVSEVHQFRIQKRTEGDGMEKEDINSLDNMDSEEKLALRDRLIYRPVDLRECSLPAPIVTGKMINLTPKVQTNEKKNSSAVKISKEPKFVPYEPYKAATNPMIKNDKSRKDRLVRLINNSEGASTENLVRLNKLSVSAEGNYNQQNLQDDPRGWEKEKQILLDEMDVLKKSTVELENRVQFQTRVNAEVKKLLVAAVGEDIETRVQSLTEDKLYLAKQLLSTADTLSTHQEQIEWLAGQSEVWRSKFLASSKLVEDLARWKAGLCQKVDKYQKALKSLLEDNDVVRRDAFQTFINLSTLREKFNLDVVSEDNNECQLMKSDLLGLCSSNHQLSDILMAQLLGENTVKKKFELDALHCLSPAEKCAEQVLSQPMVALENTDMACSAVMTGAALALSSNAPHCSHCNGSVITI